MNDKALLNYVREVLADKFKLPKWWTFEQMMNEIKYNIGDVECTYKISCPKCKEVKVITKNTMTGKCEVLKNENNN